MKWLHSDRVHLKELLPGKRICTTEHLPRQPDPHKPTSVVYSRSLLLIATFTIRREKIFGEFETSAFSLNI